MYQFPIAAHECAWKRPGYIRLRAEPSARHTTRGYCASQWGDVNGVV